MRVTRTGSSHKKLYRRNEWFEFAHKVLERDGYKCLKCHRSPPEVVLQVHHERYIRGKAPWEYALSDCSTLCKGCHAREHGHIEPDSGWVLLSIDDLGDLIGTCERAGCGKDIRYEHLTYHPQAGYKVVGSTCIEHLTRQDIDLSSDILKNYKNISKFVHDSDWYRGWTKNGKPYIETKHGHDLIRIYGKDGGLRFSSCLERERSKSSSLPGHSAFTEQIKRRGERACLYRTERAHI